MKGFVKNEGPRGTFTLQRRLYPGSTLSFDDAYLTVGEKSGQKKGTEFVKWLRENCFPGDQWAFYKEEGVPYFTEEAAQGLKTSSEPSSAPARGAGRVMKRKQESGEKGLAITSNAIIEATFPEAQTLINKCSNKSVLKKALNLSQHFAKKDEHMRQLMKRIEQVY